MCGASTRDRRTACGSTSGHAADRTTRPPRNPRHCSPVRARARVDRLPIAEVVIERTDERPRPRARTAPVPALAIFLIVGVAYGVFAQMAWSLYGASDIGVSFFPAAGITLGALATLPRRRWPWVLAAVAIAEIVVDLSNGVALGATLGFATANALEPLVGALVIGRF